LKNLNYRDVSSHIGNGASEKPHVNETIARNFSFGDPEPDLDRFCLPDQAAATNDFIMRMPDGL